MCLCMYDTYKEIAMSTILTSIVCSEPGMWNAGTVVRRRPSCPVLPFTFAHVNHTHAAIVDTNIRVVNRCESPRYKCVNLYGLSHQITFRVGLNE